MNHFRPPTTASRNRRALFSILLFSLAALSLDAGNPRYAELVSGEEVQGIIRVDRERGLTRTYVLDVPITASAIRFRITRAEADLDLFLRYGDVMEDYSQSDFYSESDAWLEELHIYKAYETFFPAGRYYLDVTYQWNEAPRRSGRRVTEIPYTLMYELFDGSDTENLVPGETIEGILDADSGYMARYQIEIPRRTGAFRIDIMDSPGDVDLFLSKGDPAPTRDAYRAIADSYLGRETLVIDETDGSLSGTWFLTVIEASETEYPVPFHLGVSLGVNPPESLPASPELPSGLPDSRAMMIATVQLLSPSGIGSGCLVSPDGLVLTNHHVVVDDMGNVMDSLVVAISSRDYEAPLESYLAEFVESSPDDDLAILRITSDRWGRPLPEDYRFPYWRLGDSDSIGIGDSLFLMGYPWMGSGAFPVLSHFHQGNPLRR